MLERYFIKPETVDRIRASWIGDLVERYVAWLTRKEYASRSVLRRVPLLLHFGEFAKNHGAKMGDELPTFLSVFVEHWVRKRRKRGCQKERLKRYENSIRGPIQQMLRLVVTDYNGGEWTRKKREPFSERVPEFFSYLREERGLRDASLLHYAHHLRRLELYLRKINCPDLQEISPPVLSAFITECSHSLSKSSMSGLCCSLRVFLRYLYRERQIPRDLSGAVESPQFYRLADIPRSISWEEVRRMLESVNLRTPLGKRDYAILLLLVTYGLRSREIAALTLDDINWKHERLRIPERKAGHSTAYPLSPLVGKAILDYLQQGRHPTLERRVFLRTCAPYTPLSREGVSTRAAYYLRKADIPVAKRGSHTLRHTCVQRLLDAHFSLKTIGDYVGHSSPASTEIYTKVSIESLREVALGDGEEMP